MAKFRKKPVVIEAVQWRGTAKSFNEILKMGLKKWKAGETGTDTFYLKALTGWRVASLSDWIIKDVKGEFYPCNPDIFDATYDPV